MRKHFAYVTAFALASSLTFPSTVYAALEDDGFTAVPEICEGEELTLTESVVDISFTDRDKDVGYGEYTELVLSDEEILADGEALSGENAAGGIQVSQEEHIVTITEEGVYLLSGTLSDGQIIVDAEDTAKVQLVLDNVDIHCENHAAMWIKSADKVFLTLADGSENVVSDGGQADTEASGDEHADADGAIFSKADLTIQGTGSLTVNGNYKHGIVSKDDLVITGGNLNVTAVENCLAGKDAVKIADGTINLKADQHAIKAKNEDDTQQGNVYLEGGSITASAVEDGINATGSIVMNGGELELTVQDDGIHSDKDLVIYGGVINIPQSYEGLEGHRITIFGGTLDVVSTDDGMNASGGSESQEEEAFAKQFRQDGGRMQMSEKPEEETMPENGEFPESEEIPENGEAPEKPEEGTMPENGEFPESGEIPENSETLEKPEEGAAPEIPENGTMSEMPRGGMHGGRNGGMQWQEGMGRGGMDSDSEAYIRICGGNIQVEAEGDGLDSNGYFYMEGGTVLVAGPVGGGDSALDYGLEAEASGGTLVAAGSSGMAQGFSQSSSQGNFLHNFSESIPAESIISLKTGDGEEIVSWRCQKAFQSVVITSPELTEGNTYVLTAGDEEVEIDL
ncbi:hypothetical protein BRYFOR_08276 [Marvinbryantia formatexigens DSM 14469]|uniref:Carbohydrate-binding domain-containing protein n=1 Tax=Marvinbryantia formatexigens DSM 14469 TaxID=478749 RepID=C6LI05_9FIRM|nr:carbohydrate-binding domain-containing protein [Marvinbryantia formatexigens]EET59660.1 hypothetical protein BRYFOR_08276 [Marvinbryantia formatexigens DSM 14469]UWO26678.1 carbohydrate-binding domain-containing protein [Marvinbryantia formatexigens DSM 14469]SDG44555.1 protein of unknown function [Marvinbryantia formatexigens]